MTVNNIHRIENQIAAAPSGSACWQGSYGTAKSWIERVNRRLRIFAYRAYRRYQIDKAELLRRLESAK